MSIRAQPSALRILAILLIAGLLGAAERAGDQANANAKAARQKILRTVLLDHFVLGVEAPREWLSEVREQNGARFDFLVQYLPGGVGKGEPWFFKYKSLENFIADSKAVGMGAWFTWYMLEQSTPAEYKPDAQKAAAINAANPATMKEYFEWFKKTMIECGKHPEVPIVMQIEPDPWCHLLIPAGFDPAKVVVKVGSCGQEDVAGLPDDENGYAAALSRLRDRYAPMVLLACNPSSWDYRGAMTGAKMGKVFKEMCPDFDLAVMETGDRDKGAIAKVPVPIPYGDSVWFCKTFPEHIQWIKEFHEASGMWVCVWQVAMGNTWFASCDNTPGHGCDNITQYLLEDYPRNDAIARYAAAGCCGFLFNGGQGFSTAAYDKKKDGITNPKPIPGNAGNKSQYADDDGGYLRLRAGAYFKKPYPLLGKPAPEAAKTKQAPAPAPAQPPKRPPVADAEAVRRYRDRLLARLREELAAGRHPRFDSARLRSQVGIETADDKSVGLTMDGSRLDLPWSGLERGELAQLATGLARQDHPEDHAVAAFFLLLVGERAAAEEQLVQAAGGADEVRKAVREE